MMDKRNIFMLYNANITPISLESISIRSGSLSSHSERMMLRKDAAEGKRVPTFRSLGVQISADTGREIRFRAARTPSVRSFVRYEARHSLLSTGFSFRCSNKNPRDAATRFNRVERRIDAARGTRCRSRIATGEKLSMKHVQTRFPSRKDGG